MYYYIFENKCYDKNKNQLIGNFTCPSAGKCSFSQLNLENVPIINTDTILLFQNRWDFNFRHFMIETFHLLTYFSDNFDNINIKIMIDENYYKHSYQILEILKLTNHIIFKKPNYLYKCKNLIWSKSNTNFHDPKYKILVKTLIKNSKLMSNITYYDFIYLSREHIDIYTDTHTPKRWITNQDEVTPIFYKHNYKKVRVDNLDFWDQVAMINNAKNIITFIGANCENIGFANDQAIFSIIYAPNQSFWANCYRYSDSLNLIECSNRDNSVDYNPEGNGEDILNGPYRVNLDILKRGFQSMSQERRRPAAPAAAPAKTEVKAAPAKKQNLFKKRFNPLK